MKWFEYNGYPAVILTQSECKALYAFSRKRVYEPEEAPLRCVAFSPKTRQVIAGDKNRAAIVSEKGADPSFSPTWEHQIYGHTLFSLAVVARRRRDIMIVFDRGTEECSIGIVVEGTREWQSVGATPCPMFTMMPYPPLHRGFDIRAEQPEPMAVVQGLYVSQLHKVCAAAKVDTAILLTSGVDFPLRAVASGLSTWDCLWMPARDRIGQGKFARK